MAVIIRVAQDHMHCLAGQKRPNSAHLGSTFTQCSLPWRASQVSLGSFWNCICHAEGEELLLHSLAYPVAHADHSPCAILLCITVPSGLLIASNCLCLSAHLCLCLTVLLHCAVVAG